MAKTARDVMTGGAECIGENDTLGGRGGSAEG